MLLNVCWPAHSFAVEWHAIECTIGAVEAVKAQLLVVT